MTIERLIPLITALGDDAWMIGHVGSEWLACAPDLEEDIAMSSVAQNDLGHAFAYYALIHEWGGKDPDAMVFARLAGDWRAAILPAHPRRDWAEWVVRRYLYEIAGEARRRALASVPDPSLRATLGRIGDETALQRVHIHRLMTVIADGGDFSRQRAEAALKACWPHWRELFAWGEEGAVWPTVASSLDPARMEAQGRAVVLEDFARWGWTVPPNLPDRPLPRRLGYFSWFRSQIARLQEVRLVAPDASW